MCEEKMIHPPKHSSLAFTLSLATLAGITFCSLLPLPSIPSEAGNSGYSELFTFLAMLIIQTCWK